MPKKVSVFGKTYKVKVSKAGLFSDDGGPLCGYVHHEKLIIMIDGRLSQADQMETLLHEFNHIVVRRLGFFQIFGAEAEEILVEGFASAYTENFIVMPL